MISNSISFNISILNKHFNIWSLQLYIIILNKYKSSGFYFLCYVQLYYQEFIINSRYYPWKPQHSEAPTIYGELSHTCWLVTYVAHVSSDTLHGNQTKACWISSQREGEVYVLTVCQWANQPGWYYSHITGIELVYKDGNMLP